MSWSNFLPSLLGGVLIGTAASLLLILKGRVFGISGILGGALLPKKGDLAWRLAILLGLVTAGFLLASFLPAAFAMDVKSSLAIYMAAGLLVGFGTQLSGGCTSGHGVCGISRLSPRSVVATLTFMAAGVLTVWIIRILGWG